MLETIQCSEAKKFFPYHTLDKASDGTFACNQLKDGMCLLLKRTCEEDVTPAQILSNQNTVSISY